MKLFYDFHIHSCLSPCADNDMTPPNIAGMGVLNNLGVMALTDHNSCANCPAFFEACRGYGIIPVAGMELTTAEDIHVVCLFAELDKAMEFSELVHSRILPIENKPEIFGDQIVADKEGNELCRERILLISSTDIMLEEVPPLVAQFGGACYPAHIDRESNGIIAILGDIPPEPGFKVAELHDAFRVEEYKNSYPSTSEMMFVSSSDAHHLWDISTDENFIEIDSDSADEDAIRKKLINRLAGNRN